MAKKRRLRIDVVPKPGGFWVARVGRRALGVPMRPRSVLVRWAVAYARARQPSQVVIHGRDGRIKDERTFGNDPFPPRG